MLKFFIILTAAMGCYVDPSEEGSNSPPSLTDRTPTSMAGQIPTTKSSKDNPEDADNDPIGKSESEDDPNYDPDGDPKSGDDPELDNDPKEDDPDSDYDPERDDPEEDPEVRYSCFSYLDCPNHEACSIMSSTCYSCTEGWQCNNQYDLKRSRPSFCCTPEAFDDERCDMIGTCKE